jgi:hypothetical protein
MVNPSASSVKLVGVNGQISLGKEFAGRQVLVEEQEAGVWLIRTATVIPDNERWLHADTAAADLDAAQQWAGKNQPNDSALDSTLARLTNGKQ